MSTTTRTHNPALARTLVLAQRSAFDLKLAHDAALACGLPYSELARIKRARHEVRDLLRALEASPPEDTLREVEGEDRRECQRHVSHPFAPTE